MGKGTSFNQYLMEELRNPRLACRFISDAISQGDPDYLKTALGDIVKAYGVSNIARGTGISRQSIYKMFAKNGNPTHKSLIAILDYLGLKLAVKSKSNK